MPLPDKRRCTVLKDGNSYHYVVDREAAKIPRSDKVETSPAVNVWWDRSLPTDKKQKPERLILRQENGRVGADVVMVTLGQAYDLIDALNQAVMNP